MTPALLYASKASNPKLTLFVAVALALVLACAIGVLAGSMVSRQLGERLLSRVAGIAFLAVGLWALYHALPKPLVPGRRV